MVVTCCAYNCNVKSIKGGSSFFGFPISNEELSKKWVLATRRKNFHPSKFTKICEKHFEEDCFQPKRWKTIKQLKETAIPTIFDFPPGYKFKKVKKPPQDSLEESRVSAGPIFTEIVSSNNFNLGAQRATIEPVSFVEKVVKTNRELNNSNVEKAQIHSNGAILNEKVPSNLQVSITDAGKHSDEKSEQIICFNCATLEKTKVALSKAQSLLEKKDKVIKVLQQKVRRQEQKINNYKTYSKALFQRVDNMCVDLFCEPEERITPD